MTPSTQLFMKISQTFRDFQKINYQEAGYFAREKDLEDLLLLVEKYGDARAEQEREALVMDRVKS